mgnify:CR=1 FL=1
MGVRKKEDVNLATAQTTTKKMTRLKKEDEGYQMARDDAVAYLETRKPAIVSVGRRYHIDPDELAQESYEVLLTCLRDYTPIVKKDDGTEIRVQFNTFFGSRLEVRAIEMRNRDPEYQARQATMEQMSDEDKTSFRDDPPLLVQHLDHEGTMQQSLRGEVAEAHGDKDDNAVLRIMRDSFFDQKLAELVAKEKDEKKQAALLHVKVGGVYNFHEIAYHFGVTDSRASQVMNELMDAFYVQRLIDRDLKAVKVDFEKLKFNEKRALRLIGEAFQFVDDDRADEIIKVFSDIYTGLKERRKKSLQVAKERAEKEKKKPKKTKPALLGDPPEYENLLTKEESKKFPLQEVGMRRIASLKEIEDLDFRPPPSEAFFKEFCEQIDPSDPRYPALVAEDGTIIDGVLRLRAARAAGRKEYLCLTLSAPDPEEKKRLRVVLNMRLHSASKVEMFHAISALSGMGFSQQKIADSLDTGRTNVLVYCKVRDKALPELRGLFEDELIQITNAATCADLSDEEQKEIVRFIRRYGKSWAKGKNFNKLYKAAASGKVAALEEKLPKDVKEKADKEITTGQTKQTSDPDAARKVAALEKQINTYAMALKDQEIWSAQREGVINQQREELSDLRGEAEALRREVEAAELIKFGDSKALDDEIKQIRAFFTITERLAAAIKGADHARKDLTRTEVRRNQASELVKLLEELEKSVNTLRVEIHNRCRTFSRDRSDPAENAPKKDK